jgi:ATP-binding cassette subfamily F protein 3
MIESPHMHFGEARRSGDVVLTVADLGKSYGDKVLFRDLSFTLPRGKRLGIMGPNGSGKTTLLRILMGDEEPTEGLVKRGHLVDFGYLDQHLKALPDDKPVLKAVWPDPDPDIDEQRMRDLLGRFGLVGDQVYQSIGSLSGGERSRAALARLVVLGVNVLVLDEPTNHLDIWACDALEQALLEYEGTCIVVSHDRYFLNRVVDLLIVIQDGKATLVHGNYDLYERMRVLQREAGPAKKERPKEEAKAPPRSSKPAKRKRKFPYRKVEELEADIAAAETLVAELEARLASPELYRDGEKVKETTRAFEETKARLAQLYEHWEEAVELN